MTVSFNIDDAAAFSSAIEILSAFESKPLTQNFAVAIAALLHRNVTGASGMHRILHQPDDISTLVSTSQMQRHICDPTWQKASGFLQEGLADNIYKPFTTRFFPATNNNWRNSFDLQAGLACDAPSTATFLLDDDYLSEPRFYCSFRDQGTAGCHSPAGLIASSRTCFNPSKRNAGQVPGPDTKAKHRPKLLTRGYTATGDAGYWYIEPNVDVLTDLLCSREARVPLFPFMVALYAGSPYWRAQSTEISENRFQGDLALGSERFLSLFDPNPNSTTNSRMLPFCSSGTNYSASTTNLISTSSERVRELSMPVLFTPRGDVELVRRAGAQSDPERRMRLLERATSGHRRALNKLAALLLEAGYSIDEQLDGYDLYAVSENGRYLFEVKTWTDANLLRQVRSGWAQLYEYRYRNGMSSDVVLCLMFDRLPPANAWVWPWLAGELNVIPCWIENESIDTFPEFRASLPKL